MRCAYIISLVFIASYSNNLFSKTYDFTLNCKITDQVILAMSEGKSERYGFYNNEQLRINDNLSLDFEFEAYDNNYYKFEIKTNVDPKNGFNLSTTNLEFNQIFRDNFSFEGTYNSMFGDNFISFESTTGRIKMHRYYKDDWNLFLTTQLVNQARTLTANCLGMSNEYSQILDYFKLFHTN